MEKKRKYELSFMNIFCCLVVIFIHINSEAVTGLDKGSVANSAAYVLWQASSFAVYGFIFLSGVKQFLNKKPVFSAGEFYVKRIRTIILPYLLWVILYYAFDCVMHIEEFDLHNLIYYIYSGDYVGHFYYIIIIAQFYLLMPLWVKLFRGVSAVLMIPFAIIATSVLGQYLPNIIDVFVPGYYFRFTDRIFTTYFAYWTVGAYIGMNYDRAKWLVLENKRFIYIAFTVSAIFAIGLSYVNFLGDNGWTWLETAMNAYRMIAVIAVFAFSLGGASKICRHSLVRLLDSSSYIIYLSHCLMLKEVNFLFDKYGVDSIGVRYFLRAAAVYIIPCAVCMAYTAVKRGIKNSLADRKNRSITA